MNERTLATYTQTGYMFLDAGTGLPGVVNEFIAAGPPPFFIGFGSNPIYYPEELAHMFRRIASQTGRRLIVSKGWAGLESSDQAEDILYVDDVPYELLFPKMAAVIHHGGTGTMAYAARAGVPQAAFPYMADQFTNRKRIFELGIGPKTCDFRKMDEKAIVEAINACVSTDSYRNNANYLAETIRTTEGTKQTADLIEKEFGRKTGFPQ
ncbi:MAG: glycosyltransferase [Bacteroidales bacterium]